MATRTRSSKTAPKKAASRNEFRTNRNRRGEGSDSDDNHFFGDVKEEKNAHTSDRDDGGEYEEDEEKEEVKQYDSDALDDEDFGTRTSSLKRKRGTSSASSPKKKKTVSRRQSSRRKNLNTSDDGDKDTGDEFELKDGQEVVGIVVEAPRTGRVPPGQISQNTFDFLTKLKDPKCNDREWFKLHEPVYRLAETEWKDFVESLTGLLTEVDTQVPPLPPKDIIHRIYRDIRFSNDKTPYKTGLSASFSRSGRKGIFAGFKPGGESLIAAGTWCPGRNELATIRANILRSSTRLRRVISAPEFVKYFGKPTPRADRGRQNVFGMDDELKVAPKGVDKEHPDIDLLKCRSFAVVHKFTDEEVLAGNFKEKVADMVRIMRPFVHCLNDMMTVAHAGGGGGGTGSDESAGEDGGEDDDED